MNSRLDLDKDYSDYTVEDLENYSWPDPLDPGFTTGLAEEARRLYEETEYAIVADGGFKSFWELGYKLRGFEQLLMDLVLNPEFVSALMAKLLEINIDIIRLILPVLCMPGRPARKVFASRPYLIPGHCGRKRHCRYNPK